MAECNFQSVSEKDEVCWKTKVLLGHLRQRGRGEHPKEHKATRQKEPGTLVIPWSKGAIADQAFI